MNKPFEHGCLFAIAEFPVPHPGGGLDEHRRSAPDHPRDIADRQRRQIMLAERAVERPRDIRDCIQQCAVEIEQYAAKRAALPDSRTLNLSHDCKMPEFDHSAYRGTCAMVACSQWRYAC